MCMQAYDSGQCQCKQDQHYTQAVSPSCNHPNGDEWPTFSTGRRDAERARNYSLYIAGNIDRVLNLADWQISKTAKFNSSPIFLPVYRSMMCRRLSYKAVNVYIMFAINMTSLSTSKVALVRSFLKMETEPMNEHVP